MKRFWKEARACPVQDGQNGEWEVTLDGRPLRTPMRAHLLLPGQGLARAIAAEWNAVAGEMTPATVPLTGLANAAVDIVGADRPAFAASLAKYAASDLTCYRAEGPATLVARQAARWEPVLKDVEARHGLLFRRTSGVMHVDQPAGTLAGVEALLAGLSPFELAALQPMITIGGSVVLALAHLQGGLGWEAAFDAGALDEDWQAGQWGADAQALEARALRRAEFEVAARFLALSRG